MAAHAQMSPEILSTNAEQAFKDVCAAVRSGECNLFLGAAVHAGAPEGSPYSYPKEDRPPIGAGLAEILDADTDYRKRYGVVGVLNLQRVAQDYEKEKGRDKLIEAVTNAVEKDRKSSAALRALAELDFPVVITTNYDTLFQQALGRHDKVPFLSWYESNDPEQSNFMPKATRDLRWNVKPEAKKPFLFKIHGDIQTGNSIVITEEDYIQFLLRMGDRPPLSPVPDTVLASLKSRPTIFIGYSLNDFNLRLLLKALRQAAQDRNDFPPLYSVDMKPDPLIWWWYSSRHHVNFVAWDVWDFVPRLYKEVTGREMDKE